MGIPKLDVDAFEHPEHIMIAACRAVMENFGIVTKVEFRVDRQGGEYQIGSLGDTAREYRDEEAK